jgi:hypothetical protein
MFYNKVIYNVMRISFKSIGGGLLYFLAKDFYEIAFKQRRMMTTLNYTYQFINPGFVVGFMYALLI